MKAALLTSGAALLLLGSAELYFSTVSRTLRALKRGITAAVAAYLEERGGIQLFTLEEDDLEAVTPTAWQLPAAALRLPRAGAEQAALGGAGGLPRPGSAPRDEGWEAGSAGGGSGEGGAHFLESAKLFSCLDLQESRLLYQHASRVELAPRQVLFRAGDCSSSGVFVVVEGRLGVYLEGEESGNGSRQSSDDRGSRAGPRSGGSGRGSSGNGSSRGGGGGTVAGLLHTNTLGYGESVGDLDVVDGAPRTVTCAALEGGCTLVQVPRDLFLRFVLECPRALQIYLQKAIGRLWRVAHFTLSDFLDLPLDSFPLPPQAPTPVYSLLPSQLGTLLPPEAAAAGMAVGSSAGAGAAAPEAEPVLAAGAPQAGVAAGQPAMLPGASLPAAAPTAAGPSPVGAGAAAAATPPDTPVPAFERGSQRSILKKGGAASSSREGLAGQLRSRVSFERLPAEPSSPAVPSSASTPSTASPSPLPAQAAAEPGPTGYASPLLGPAGSGGGWLQQAGTAVRVGLAQRSTAREPGEQAGLARGWDVVGPGESGLSGATWDLLRGTQEEGVSGTGALPGPDSPAEAGAGAGVQWFGRRVALGPGQFLYEAGEGCRHFYVLVEGSLRVERGEGGAAQPAAVAPGSLLCCAAWLSAARAHERCWAGPHGAFLVAFGPAELDLILAQAAGLLSPASSSAAEEEELPTPFSQAGQKQQEAPGSTAQQQPSRQAAGAAARGEGTDTLLKSGGSGPPSQQQLLQTGAAASPPSAARPSSPPPTPCPAPPAPPPPRGPRRRLAALRSVNSGALADAELLRVGSLPTSGVLPTLSELAALRPASPTRARRPATADFAAAAGAAAAAPAKALLALAVSNRALASGAAQEAASAATRGWLPLQPVDEDALTGGGSSEQGVGRAEPAAFGEAASSSAAIAAPPGPATAAEAAAAGFVDLLLAAGRALGPAVRRFLLLGFNRTWLHAGDVVYRQGEAAENLYLVISGRARLLHYSPQVQALTAEDDVGRGDSMGAVWALAGGSHDTSCLCTRDTELVRLNKAAFEALAAQHPRAAARVLQGMAERLAAASAARRHPSNAASAISRVPGGTAGAAGTAGQRRGEIVTIALVPAGSSQPSGSSAAAAAFTSRLARALRSCLESMWGPTLLLTSQAVGALFPTAYERLAQGFFRSKVTAWMAAQEEEYRFILLQADPQPTPWSRICTAQADCTLLVADPHTTRPQVSALEEGLLWSALHDAQALLQPHTEAILAEWEAQRGWGTMLDVQELAGAGQQASRGDLQSIRRVELVLLHELGQSPSGTAAWLAARPHLTRHHHIRPTHPPDLARLSRWMAGQTVGVVLGGGGSRGLAHLGVLWALDDAGVPIDVVGGTSQGAFMAALYAQGLPFSGMQAAVKRYAMQMSSVPRLLRDLTLPLISVFSGSGFDSVVREALSQGPQRIEDLWHTYFCVSTNLSLGAQSVHQRGLLWKLVRASMTIIGLLPPVFDEGCLLCDGGYLNNAPVDVMHSLGVGKVILVDVEDRDQSAWHNLTPFDSLSGWQLLWDRWCPIPSWRYNLRIPKYAQLVNALSWMSHMQNLRRMSQDYVIDLYLRPPVTHFKLMDYHLADRIVRDATRYAWAAVSEWQSRVGVHLTGPRGLGAAAPLPSSPAARGHRPLAPAAGAPAWRWRRSHSMSQLQAKARRQGSSAAEEEEGGEGGPGYFAAADMLPAAERLARAATLDQVLD